MLEQPEPVFTCKAGLIKYNKLSSFFCMDIIYNNLSEEIKMKEPAPISKVIYFFMLNKKYRSLQPYSRFLGWVFFL